MNSSVHRRTRFASVAFMAILFFLAAVIAPWCGAAESKAAEVKPPQSAPAAKERPQPATKESPKPSPQGNSPDASPGKGVPTQIQISTPTSAETASQAAAEMATETKPGDLKPEEIEARLKEIKENSTLPQEQRDKAAETLQAALDARRKATEFETKAKEFSTIQEGSQKIVEALKAEAKALPGEPTIEIPEDSSVTSLEQLQTKTEAEASDVAAKLAEIERILKNFSDRRLELPKMMADAKSRAESASQSLKAGTPVSDVPELTGALKILFSAQKKSAESEGSALERELQTYEVRLEIAKARRDLLTAKSNYYTKLVKAWKDTVNVRRKLEAEREAQKAREALRAAANDYPLVALLAKDNASMAEKRTGANGLASKIEATSRQIDRDNKLLSRINDDYKSILDKIKATGLTNAIGLLLRVKRSEIPPIGTFSRNTSRRSAEISNAQLQMIELDERLAALSDIDQATADRMVEVGVGVTGESRDYIRNSIKELLQSRRTLIEALLNDFNSYFVRLVDLDSLEKQLMEKIIDYSGFIDERILWIESCQVLNLKELSRAAKGLYGLLNPKEWAKFAAQLLTNATGNPVTIISVILALFCLLLLERRLLRRMPVIADAVSKPATDSFYLTLEAILITLAASLFWPMVLLALGYASVMGGPDSTEFSKALSAALVSMAKVLVVIYFIRSIFMSKGLGECHFKWRPVEILPSVRKGITYLIVAGSPIFFVFKTIQWMGDEAVIDSLGRILFMAGMIVFSISMHRLLKPSGKVFGRIEQSGRTDNVLYRIRHVLYTLGSILPLSLLALAALGYFYTSIHLFERSTLTLAIIFCAQVFYSIIYRILFIVQRTLAQAKASEKRAQIEQAKAQQISGQAEGGDHRSGGPGGNQSASPAAGGSKDNPLAKEMAISIAETEPTIHAMGKQARKFFLWVTMISALVSIWYTWLDVMPALRALNRVQLWTTVMKVSAPAGAADGSLQSKLVAITLFDLLLAIVLSAFTFIVSKHVPTLLDFSVLRRLPMDNGVRFAIRTVISYIITIFGLLWALYLIGITWEKAQWLITIIGVGLGFGLQEIFANFVSGLIILFEQPMRVGDIVTVGDQSGTVTRIQIRATTITDWDRKEVIIPNKEFITGRLINWTLSDTILRVIFNVGVAYGSDTDKVQALLLRVAENCPTVLKDPPFKAIFNGFGDSSLNFELRVFIPNMDGWADFLHGIHTSIDKAFRENDVEIPFPQRDIHVRSITHELPPALTFTGQARLSSTGPATL